MDKEEIRKQVDAVSFYRTFYPDFKPNGKKYVRCLCPFHDDHNPSLNIYPASGRFHCPACGAHGDIFDFYQRRHSVDFPTAIKAIAADFTNISTDKPTGKPKVVASFEYHDPAGNVVYIKERIEPGRDGKPKDFPFKHTENGKWVNGRGGEPVLYRLPDLINSRQCFIVEGEKKADLLLSWGITATCLDTGAGSQPRDEYLPFLTNKDAVVIVRDNDDPGKGYADRIANALHGKVKDLRVVELPGLNEGDDILDWAKLPGNNKETLLKLVENTPIFEGSENSADGAADADPYKIRIPDVEFPIHVFPEEFREFVRKVSLSVGTANEVAATTALVLISAAIGNTMRISPKSNFEVSPFLWAAIVGASGGGKSHIFSALMKPIKKMQAEAAQKYKQQMDEYREAEQNCKRSETSEMPDHPALNQFYASDSTIEALSDIFERQPRGILGFHDELSGFIRGMDQYRASRGNDRQHYLQLFNAQPWKIDRRSRSAFVPNTGLAIIGGIQPQIIPDIFADNSSFFDGFIQRFIFVCTGNKPLRFSRAALSESDYSYWNALIHWCYEIPLTIDESDGAAEPKVLILEDDALCLWESFHNTYAELSTVVSYKIGNFIPKLHIYSLKLAGILQAIKGFAKNRPPHAIDKETIRGAIELTDYFFGQAYKVVELYDSQKKKHNECYARILNALFALRPEVKNGKLALSRIVDQYKRGLPEYAWLTSEKISKILNTDFELQTKKSTGNLSCLVWEEARMEKLFHEHKQP
ncbi:MAG: DUF3987 domain-containing protein [Candidatus Brocadia sp.]|nr:DUF3987 domain-containing protein [Candidatus Brocadia sp.]